MHIERKFNGGRVRGDRQVVCLKLVRAAIEEKSITNKWYVQMMRERERKETKRQNKLMRERKKEKKNKSYSIA